MITAFLPCRSGSERVPFKNTKSFAGVKDGLLGIKLRQLLKAKLIDRIVLSTNDTLVMGFASKISNEIIVDIRPEHLAQPSTSTDDLINHIPKIIEDQHILWTHVTSPFMDETVYDSAIKTYFEKIKNNEFDSLMTVNTIQTFLWDEKGSINYNRDIEKWPRTQTLPEIFEINSGIFINSRNSYIKLNDRIGKKPYLFKTEGYSSFDIDWPEDFKLAELIFKSQKR